MGRVLACLTVSTTGVLMCLSRWVTGAWGSGCGVTAGRPDVAATQQSCMGRILEWCLYLYSPEWAVISDQCWTR